MQDILVIFINEFFNVLSQDNIHCGTHFQLGKVSKPFGTYSLRNCSTVALFGTTGWQSTEQVHTRSDRLPWEQAWLCVCAWVAVAVVTRVVALFPFSEADAASNRSRKSFVFWQCEVGGAAGWWLVSEFQLSVGDWPRRSNGAVSRRCRIPPLPITTSSSPCSSHPSAPTLRSSPVLIVTHCLLRLEMWLTTQAICWSTALTTEGFFWRAPCVLVIWGQAVETTLLPWQWICLRFYACWSSHPLRWKVNKRLGLYLL